MARSRAERSAALLAALLSGCGATNSIDLTRLDGGVAVSGTVSGLAGSGLTLQDSGADDLLIPANGPFTFATRLQAGAVYAVTVSRQPINPLQTCAVQGGTGTAGASGAAPIAITCTTNPAFTLGGTVSGLLEDGLILQNSGADDLTVPAGATSFVFATPVQEGANYAITARAQPPDLNCSIQGGQGLFPRGGVNNAQVTCVSDPGYNIGGTVSGLTGAGLVLQDNGGDDLVIGRSGAFKFAHRVHTAQSYSVTVKTQPISPQQTCLVASGSGVVAADVTSIQVTCSVNLSYSIGVTVSGLLGQALVLQNNGGDDLSLSQNGTFAFPTQLQQGQPYSVTVAAQPYGPDQTCTVANGAGVVGTASPANLQVTCTTLIFHSVGGSVSGLAGTGLVLQDDGTDDLPIAANGAFAFPTRLHEGAPYSISVKTQPARPFQTCTVSGGGSGTLGTADLHSVSVVCVTNPGFKLGGSVAGLGAAGLVLQDNGGDDLAVPQSGAFAFPTSLQAGQQYRASIKTQPAGQQCGVTAGGAGVMAGSAFSPIQVSCGAQPYSRILLQASGVAGAGLVLQENGGDDLAISADGSYSFANQFSSGQAYAVTIRSQPAAPLQTCSLSANASGTFGASDLAVTLGCSTNPSFNVPVQVTGLAGSGLLLTDNGSDSLAISGNGHFVFPAQLQSGQAYSISVVTQPSGPFQTCTVTNPRGTVGQGDVSGIFIGCTTNQFYLVGGFVNGLEGSGLVLQGPGSVTIGQDGLFVFPTLLQRGQSYSAAVISQPNPAQVCTIANASGTVAGSNALVMQVTCADNPYFVSGTVAGLTGSGLVLQNATDELLPISQSGPFSFTLPLENGAPYFIRVQTQPSGQSCSVFPNSGVASAPVTDLAVLCVAVGVQLGGTITGLPQGATVTLQDNVPQTAVVTGNGTGTDNFVFNTPITIGRAYTAAIVGGSSASCTLTAGAMGTVAAAGSGSLIAAACVPAFNLSGTLTGVAGNNLRLTNSTTGESITIAKAATSFAFAQAVTQAQGYAISISAQPGSPTQSCTLDSTSAPASAKPTADVTGISFTCTTSSFAVGGAVSGLPAGATVTLLDNNADATVINGAGDGSASIPFSFNAQLPSGAGYSSRVGSATGPATGCAVVSGGAGTVGAAAVTSIQVSCTPTHQIGGTIAGYTGSGLQLVLKNLAANQTLQTITLASGSSSFSFSTQVTQAQGYSLFVAVQPTSTPRQVCAFVNGTPDSGTPAADVTTAALSCSGTLFNVGGTVSGLPAGASVTLQDNGFDRVTVTGNKAFTFPTQLGSGSAYGAAVFSATGPASCAISSGASGTVNANVTSIQVTCTAGFSIAGTIASLAGNGLLLTNSTTGETLSLAKGATTFAFAREVSTAQGYSLSVTAQPAGPVQTCGVSGTSPSGAAGHPTANVTAIALSCTTTTFAVGGVITGLSSGTTVTLTDNGADSITLRGTGNGSAAQAFSFPAPVPSGQAYSALVAAGTGVSCTLSNGTGAVTNAAVSNLSVACAPGFSVGGTLAFYAGTGLKLRNGPTNEVLTVPAGQSTFTFALPVTTAQGYSISFAAQPVSPLESCNVLGVQPTPAVGRPTANVTDVPVICQPATFRVGGAVTGLPAGASVTLQNDLVDTTRITNSNGATTPINFSFNTAVADGHGYSAAIIGATSGISCSLTGATGTVAAANVTSLAVVCAPAFALAGTISGALGSGLQLVNSSTGEAITIAPGQTSFAFTQLVTAAQGYSVSVLEAPVNPSQGCAVTNGAGTPSADVTNLAVNCTISSFTVGGVVNGLTSGGLGLQLNGGATLFVGPQTPDSPAFRFTPPLASGLSYSVAVVAQPTGLVCLPRAGTGIGAVAGGAVLSVIIDCAPAHALSGRVTGLLGSGLAITDGAESLSVAAAGGADVPFMFSKPFAQGQVYQASVSAQPQTPVQTCSAQGGSNGDGSGTMGASDDASLVIHCGAPSYRVGGAIVGLANGAAGVVVLNNNANEQYLASFTAASTGASTAFKFATPVLQGQPYSVTVQTPPLGLNCIVRGGSGTVGTSDVTSIQVVCGYAVSGTFDVSAINGISGQLPPVAVTLGDSITPGTNTDPYSDNDSLTIPPGTASFAFNDPVPYGRSCALTLATPTGPGLSCSFEPSPACGGGAVGAAQTITLRCAPAPALALVPFAGATGSAAAVGSDASGILTAAGNFTGAVDLGHGTRTASTFVSGSFPGSGFLTGLDANGFRGSLAAPSSSNWDLLLPAAAAVKANAGAARVRAVAVLPTGEVIAGGSAIGSVDFGDGKGPIAFGTTESMFLLRASNTGAVVWAQHFGAGAIASVAVGGTQIAVGGVFGNSATSTETFGACAKLTAGSAHREFAASFGLTAGGCNYSINLGAGADPVTAPIRLGPAVALDSLGSLILAGNSLDNKGVTQVTGPYLITYDSTGKSVCFAGNAGNELLRDPTTPANDFASSVAVGPSDSLYVGGACRGAPLLHGAAVACDSPSAFVAVYRGRAACQGTALVGAQAGGAPQSVFSVSGGAQALALALDAAGDLYMAGNYQGAPAFGGVSAFAGSSALNQNLFLARFGPGLAAPLIQAVTSSGALGVSDLALGAGGSAWLSGSYSGTVTYKGITQLGSTTATTEPMLLQFPQSAP